MLNTWFNCSFSFTIGVVAAKGHGKRSATQRKKKLPSVDRIYGEMACWPCIIDNSMDDGVPRFSRHLHSGKYQSQAAH